MPTTTYSNKDLVRLISDLSSELELTKTEIARLKGKPDKVSKTATATSKEFVKVDPRVVAYAPSGTNGDGTYQAASTVDFSSSVASWAKKVYIYVAIVGTDTDSLFPQFGFTWKPTGWTDTLEVFSSSPGSADLVNIEEHQVHCLPISNDLTVDIAVVKIDNSGGASWSYSFEVWGYE